MDDTLHAGSMPVAAYDISGLPSIRVDQPRCDAGFSLLEVIVSVTLLALMLALTPAALRMGRQSWNATGQLERSAAITAGLDVVRRAIAAARPIIGSTSDRQRMMFSGGPEQLAFIAPAPAGYNHSGGIVRLRLDKVAAISKRGYDLVMFVEPLVAQTTHDRPAGTPAVLIEDVSDIALRYFGEPIDGGAPRWFSTWTERDRLPRLVELTVRLSGTTRPPEVIVMSPRLAAAQ